MTLVTEATCRACGARVSSLWFDLHIEDHQQRGESPTADAAGRTLADALASATRA